MAPRKHVLTKPREAYLALMPEGHKFKTARRLAAELGIHPDEVRQDLYSLYSERLIDAFFLINREDRNVLFYGRHRGVAPQQARIDAGEIPA